MEHRSKMFLPPLLIVALELLYMTKLSVVMLWILQSSSAREPPRAISGQATMLYRPA